MSSAAGIKICTITAGIKKYKSIITKKRKKHDKIVLLAKTKLNTIEVLISKALTDSYINRDEIVSVNNVLRQYNEMKKEIKNRKNCCGIHHKKMETYCVSCKKNTVNENTSVRRTKENRLMLVSNCAFFVKRKSRFIKNQELH